MNGNKPNPKPMESAMIGDMRKLKGTAYHMSLKNLRKLLSNLEKMSCETKYAVQKYTIIESITMIKEIIKEKEKKEAV